MNDQLDNRPWSEIYRVAAERWVDLEAAASLLEETKTSVMAQKQAALGDMAVNRAEQTIKASRTWMEHLEKIVAARKAANHAKVNMDVIKMQVWENNNRDANARAEMKL